MAAALLVILGAAAGVGAALATSAVHTGSRTTTVVVTGPATGGGSSAAAVWSTVYAHDSPGTVDITVTANVTTQTPLGPRQSQATELGSGFVLNGAGDIVTASHVVADAGKIEVTLQDGQTRSATLLGRDNATDVAVLRLNPSGLTLHPLRLGSSRSMVVGNELAVIGDPFGFERSLSTGVVSALDRTIQAPNGFEIAHAIQTDATMNPGNSGGPVLDTQGRVVGIADQIATGNDRFGTGSATSTGVGFAVPIDLIRNELGALERGQTVAHPYLGVGLGQAMGTVPGALVTAVGAGTPAARAGLRVGDVIVAVDGRRLTGFADLIAAIASDHPGQRITVTIVRGSSRRTLTLTLGAQPTRARTS